MKKNFFGVFLFSFLFISCGSSSDIPKNEDTSLGTISQQRAVACVEDGDLSCAQTQYCGLQSKDSEDTASALRCCVSQFLQVYFSENTTELAKMLGYSPATFKELRQKPLSQLLTQHKLVFGDLFLASASEASTLENVFTGWGRNLIAHQVSTATLNTRVKKLGADLEGVHACLTSVTESLSEDELEKSFFGTSDKIRVTLKDVQFLEFTTAAISYLLQSVFEYEWGFDRFPAWPLTDSFYTDINGHTRVGDLRFGDLFPSAALNIVGHASLMKDGFASFRSFLNANASDSLADRWLHWRFSRTTLQDLEDILTTADLSLTSGQWEPIPHSDYSVHLSSLLNTSTLPRASHLSPVLDLLVKDGQGNPDLNSAYMEELLSPLVRK